MLPASELLHTSPWLTTAFELTTDSDAYRPPDVVIAAMKRAFPDHDVIYTGTL